MKPALPFITLSLPSPKDENAYYENTTWCNRDLIPIPADRRTFGVLSYFGAKRHGPWTVDTDPLMRV